MGELTATESGASQVFSDYPQEPAKTENAPASSPARPRPILCIADGCLCSMATEEAYEAGIPRDQLPLGCAELH